MKKNIDYYQHFTDSHLHPKFKMLRVKYGWAGEGMFWALNNIIGNSENCKLDLSRKFIVADILDLFGMTKEEFEDFINYLVDDCELIDRENNILTTEITQENFDKALSKRRKSRENYYKERSEAETDISASEITFSDAENIQSKVKENKVKENKEEESKEKENLYFFFIKSLYLKNTKIKDPKPSQINPILQFFDHIPEGLKKKDIEACITETFQELPKWSGIKTDFLIINIRRKITEKHEKIITKNKAKLLKEAKKDRILTKKEKKEELLSKLRDYKEFYEKNEELFSDMEKVKILHFLKKNEILKAGMIIEPKMEEIKLI